MGECKVINETTLEGDELIAVGERYRGQAEQLYRCVAENTRDTPSSANSGPIENPLALFATNDLANFLARDAKAGEADSLYESFVAGRAKLFGPSHAATLLAKNTEIARYGPTQESARRWESLVNEETESIGPNHVYTLDAVYNLAQTLFAIERLAAAAQYCELAANGGREVWGNDSKFVLKVSALNSQILARKQVMAAAVSSPPSSAPSVGPAATKPSVIPQEGPLIAVVTAVVNKVRFRTGPDKPWQFAKVGDTFLEGTEIQTLPFSRLQFKLPPDQTFAIDRVSVFRLQRAIFRNGKLVTEAGLEFGRQRYDIDDGSIEHDATIHSANATLAVHG